MEHGGKDEIENLICLCPDCHDSIHKCSKNGYIIKVDKVYSEPLKMQYCEDMGLSDDTERTTTILKNLNSWINKKNKIEKRNLNETKLILSYLSLIQEKGFKFDIDLYFMHTGYVKVRFKVTS